MKTTRTLYRQKALRFAVLLVLPLLYYVLAAGFKGTITNSSGQSAQPYIQYDSKDFTNCIFTPEYFWIQNTPQLYIENNLTNFSDQLHFNAINWYDFGVGSTRFGTPKNLLSQDQIDNYKAVLNQVSQKPIKGFYEKCNFSGPMYGQRLVYEIQNAPDNPWDINYGFMYQTCMQNTYTTDQGRTVLWVRPGVNSAGYLCRDIYENFQHTDLFDFRQKDEGLWRIKPVMRIPTGLADGLPVATIEVVAYDNTVVKTISVYTEHFKNGGTYNGNYISFYPLISDLLQISGSTGNFDLNKGRSTDFGVWTANCKVDFRVKWEGQVQLWFDKMVVDDEIAEDVFEGRWDQYIEQQAREFTNYPSYYTFFTDETCISQVPCIKYVINKMRSTSNLPAGPLPKFSVAVTNYLHIRGLRNDNLSYKYFFDSLAVERVQMDAHKFYAYGSSGGAVIPNTVSVQDSRIPSGWLQPYNVYNSWLQNECFGDKNTTFPNNDGTFIYQLNKIRSDSRQYSPQTLFIMQPQIHGWLFSPDEQTSSYTEGLREPTNEEIQAQAMISIAHGADGLAWFTYESSRWQSSTVYVHSSPTQNVTAPQWTTKYGLLNPEYHPQPYSPRTINSYNENKWNDVALMNDKITNKWKSTLDAATWSSGWSVHSEYNSGAFSSYIADIQSIYRDINSPYDFNPVNEDASNQRYWELGFFDPLLDGNFTKYFMFVNRRCVPETSPGVGDLRQLKVKFNGSHLAGFNNWAIIDVSTNQIVVTISRTSNSYYDLGTFNPGEGRLYKIFPAFIKGGELVTDEDISGKSITCLDTIINNGYNITIDSGSTISFTDSAAIIMNGGTFTSGALNEQSSQTTYKGSGSNKWGGLQLNGSTVKIYNSKFQDISSPVINYAVKMVNCPLADIRANQFVMSSDTSGAVQSVYLDGDGLPTFQCLYIAYNNITMNNSRANGIMVQGFSGLTLPVYIMNNTMTSNGYAQGVMLSSVTGGSVKNNSVTGFATGINSLLSTVNVFSNTITNTSSLSKGMLVTGSASLSLVPSGGLWLGGFNTVTNTYGASVNIEANNSVFVLGGGKNMFDVISSAQSYHLYGSFYSSRYSSMANDNCFKLSGTEITSPNLPRDSVLNGSNEITFNYNDYLCGPSLPESQTIINLGNGLYDTIPGSSGEGAGVSSYTQITPKAMYDTVRVRLAKQNYAGVKTACYDLINAYPDSMQSILSLQTLYLSTIMTDTTYAGLSQLKTYYETLILNHPGNTAMVRISNYMAQKCRVMLKQYTSALAGFQQIINNNPYSYEGLAAKWDYMATSLLAPGGGGENSKPEIRNPNYDENVESVPRTDTKEELYWGDDKNPFTKEEKQQIISSVKNAFEQAKNDDEVKIQKLEEAAETGDINAEKELNTMKTLKQIVRTEKPHNIMEHINIVSSDAQKVFGNTQPAAETKTTAIPQVFSLSQNFPNPFNPVTTIRYALPKDVKVVVKIYDILGREVKTLVNEIQQAGYYDVKFDMSSYASGVYFYRIEAGEFVQSKKMVLVK